MVMVMVCYVMVCMHVCICLYMYIYTYLGISAVDFSFENVPKLRYWMLWIEELGISSRIFRVIRPGRYDDTSRKWYQCREVNGEIICQRVSASKRHATQRRFTSKNLQYPDDPHDVSDDFPVISLIYGILWLFKVFKCSLDMLKNHEKPTAFLLAIFYIPPWMESNHWWNPHPLRSFFHLETSPPFFSNASEWRETSVTLEHLGGVK